MVRGYGRVEIFQKKKFNFSLVATFLRCGTSPLLFWYRYARICWLCERMCVRVAVDTGNLVFGFAFSLFLSIFQWVLVVFFSYLLHGKRNHFLYSSPHFLRLSYMVSQCACACPPGYTIYSLPAILFPNGGGGKKEGPLLPPFLCSLVRFVLPTAPYSNFD